MAHFKRHLTALVLACAVALALASSAVAVPTVNGNFPVPGAGSNHKIAPGPDGNMWTTVTNGEKDVARITPAGGVEEFELEEVTDAEGITAGPEGLMWVTTANGVAKFSTADPKGSSKDFNTGATGLAIVTGPDKNLWVGSSEKVFKFAPSNPAGFVEFKVKELAAKDIDVSGSLIVVADSNNFEDPVTKVPFGRIVTLTTAGIPGEIKIPGGSQGLAGSPGGQIAFSAPGANPEQIGIVNPPSPFSSYVSVNDPQGVALGADGAYWVAQFTPGALDRVTTSGAHTTLTGLPPSGPRQISAGPNNTLWVTSDKSESPPRESSVVRISGVDPPLPPPPPSKVPQTKLAKHPKHVVKTRANRATVKFRFSADTAGATFQCALSKPKKLKKGQKAPKPKFAGCKSPKTYKLKPGKYRFAVRGVTAAGADASPASFGFKVVKLKKHHHR